MKIAHQAWRFVVPAALAGLWGLGMALKRPTPPAVLLALLGLGFAAFSLYFFRDPERPLPTDDGKIYSPGDGTVLSVAREGDGDAVTLRVFLSIFNVHVQRAPCAGRVTKVETIPGSFAAAMKAEARGNARVVMTLEPGAGRGPLVVEQIAGLIARRIECWPKPGESLRAGQRYGIIYFGSQAAVHFPAGSRCTVKPGDTLAAGLSEIGEWTSTR
jgi:phosphatidylserine decarboxylase